jgi:hypothetical protein
MVFIIVVFIVDVRYGLLVSTILLFGFLILFVINKKMQTDIIEGYESTTIGIPKRDNNTRYAKSAPKPCLTSDQFKTFSDPARRKPQIVEKNMKSLNHALEGGQNPKTLIPPMITTPIYDRSTRKSSQIVPNIINRQTNENLYLSGYLEDHPDTANPNVSHRTMSRPTPIDNGEVIENYDPSYSYAKKTWDNTILVGNGYDPEQLESSGFPGNLPGGNCMRNPNLKKYNDNLFTQTVQPGVYYKNEIAEPINSNIGISFQQQFNPRTYKEKGGSLFVTDHDPNFAPDPEEIIENPEEPNISNVYDPRFYGYGTSYRNYVDSVTGQPRFPYDDINATKMPNYVVRSKLDTHNFSDTYGPMQNSGLSLNEVRKKAQDAFLEDSLHFRNDLTTRLMRKRNSEMWQEKMYPKSRAYLR